MIDFRVKSSGAILDIAPDASFQIEYENPMFADDRCPLAFSTEVSFLPTARNKEQFGYLAAMLLLPSVKELDVEVYAFGIKILDGMLRFSSLKDEMINYTFAGRSLEDNWSGKIFEKQICQVSGEAAGQISDITDIMSGDVDGVFAPLLVNASETDKLTILQEDSGYESSDCAPEVKYHNYPIRRTPIGSPYTVLTPAISVSKILEQELQNISFGDGASGTVEELLDTLAILGQYKTDFASTPSGIPSSGLELARALPDITALELFRIILKMFCCALFRDGDAFVVKNLGDILQNDVGVLNWEEKISRTAEVSTLPAGGYRFSFANGADEEFNPNETVSSVDSFTEMFDELEPDEMYQAFRHSVSDNIISARRQDVQRSRGGGVFPMLMCDLLSPASWSIDDQPKDGDGTVYDSTVPAKLARSIPDKLEAGIIVSARDGWRMAAIINPENVGDKRGSDVIIGRIDGAGFFQQFGDGTVFFDDDTEQYTDYDDRLNAEALFDSYHFTFARWCCVRHQVVVSDLKLSMPDIASFRMWQKVSFAGREWLVRKLTVTFYAANGRCDVSGEFVSVD